MGHYDWLPPIHRPGGARALHDDYPWPLCYIPRTWTSFKMFGPPQLKAGNQQYWRHWADGRETQDYKPFGSWWGPKPIPRPGEWQISVVTISIFWVVKITLPYFAIKTRKGWHVRIGARWSDDHPYNYVTWPTIAIKHFKN